jgi:ribonuclease T
MKLLSSATMAKRFRGFLPVVIDAETGGFDSQNDALLEVAMVLIDLDSQGIFSPGECHAYHITPFSGSHLDPEALAVNRIDPQQALRQAIPEAEALQKLFAAIEQQMQRYQCHRAVLVGHNPTFDLDFIKAAVARCGLDKMPLHQFTAFDTATLGAVFYGQTVLARIAKAAKIPFNKHAAHSAIYDAQKTAEIFCKILNQ